MDHPTPMLRRPVRAAAIVAGCVALVGSGAALVPGVAAPSALGFALVYGVILGWYVVGLALASRFRATRWFWFGAGLPLMCMAFIALGLASRPEVILSWWRVIGGVSLVVNALWLSAGFLLAVCGWCSYARPPRPVADARPQEGISE